MKTLKSSVQIRKARPSRAKPRAVITITEEGDRISMTCKFLPHTTLAGPLAPAHQAAAEILEMVAKSHAEEDES